MNELEKKKIVLDLLYKLDIPKEFKGIILLKIDQINLDELLKIIEKYSNKLEQIQSKNTRLKSDLNNLINKYQNDSEEFIDNSNDLNELE